MILRLFSCFAMRFSGIERNAHLRFQLLMTAFCSNHAVPYHDKGFFLEKISFLGIKMHRAYGAPYKASLSKGCIIFFQFFRGLCVDVCLFVSQKDANAISHVFGQEPGKIGKNI